VSIFVYIITGKQCYCWSRLNKRRN